MTDSLTNPRTIIEILSPSTGDFDRGGKFNFYQQLPSFEEYVLIAQDQPRVDVFRLRSPDHWSLDILRGSEGVVSLSVTTAAFTLAELYAGVVFPDPTEPPAA